MTADCGFGVRLSPAKDVNDCEHRNGASRDRLSLVRRKLLGLLELDHPALRPGDDIVATIAPMASWWTTLHVLQFRRGADAQR
jgi:hypothetical protein